MATVIRICACFIEVLWYCGELVSRINSWRVYFCSTIVYIYSSCCVIVYFFSSSNNNNNNIETVKFGSSVNQLSMNLTSQCNAACNCNVNNLEPVCGANMLAYFSPCHAGCTRHGITFTMSHTTVCNITSDIAHMCLYILSQFVTLLQTLHTYVFMC